MISFYKVINFCVHNHEKYLNNSKIDEDELNYFIKLNEGVVDFISSVATALANGDENKQEVFKNYIPDILDYLTTMMENPMFNPSNNYLSSTFALLIDFGEIYKKYIFKKLNDYTLQRLFQLANDSNDDDIIQLKDYLQNLIFTIKMQS